MILFNLGAIPRSSDIIFELININKHQRRYKTNKEYQTEVKHPKESIHLENAVA